MVYILLKEVLANYSETLEVANVCGAYFISSGSWAAVLVRCGEAISPRFLPIWLLVRV